MSLSLSKETICRIHCAPLAGESGWKWTRPGAAGSARPATSQDELWKAYLGSQGGSASLGCAHHIPIPLHPSPPVSLVIQRHEVHQQNVVGQWVQP